MTSLRALQAQNIPLHPAVLERENDTGLVVKRNYYEDEPIQTKCYTHGLGRFTKCMEKERGDHESKNKRERENVGDARIEMMKMKRVRIETCMTRTMKGIKVKEKKRNRS